jgi:hypothetical protein
VGYQVARSRGDTIVDMHEQTAGSNRHERLVAVLYATIAVLGLVTVVTALVVFFPGQSGFDVPLP